MKPGDIVNAKFNGCHCFARITDVGETFEETFYKVTLLSPCVMKTGTVPAGTQTWVWPEMVTLIEGDIMNDNTLWRD